MLSSLPSIGVKILLAIVLILPFRFITVIRRPEPGSAILPTGAAESFHPRRTSQHLRRCVPAVAVASESGNRGPRPACSVLASRLSSHIPDTGEPCASLDLRIFDDTWPWRIVAHQSCALRNGVRPGGGSARRLCCLMLGAARDRYHHVREGVITVAGLGLVLVVMIAWRMGQRSRRSRRFSSAGRCSRCSPYSSHGSAPLSSRPRRGARARDAARLFAAAVHRYGYPATLALVVGPHRQSPTPSPALTWAVRSGSSTAARLC